MRNISVAADLVGGIDNDDTLGVGKHACGFAQHGCLADTGTSEQQNALARLDNVPNNVHRAKDGTTDTARETDNAALAIADRRNAMEGARDARAIVSGKVAYARGDIVNVGFCDLMLGEVFLTMRKASFGFASEVQYDFDKVLGVVDLIERHLKLGR
jgi:hypothetical protein